MNPETIRLLQLSDLISFSFLYYVFWYIKNTQLTHNIYNIINNNNNDHNNNKSFTFLIHKRVYAVP